MSMTQVMHRQPEVAPTVQVIGSYGFNAWVPNSIEDMTAVLPMGVLENVGVREYEDVLTTDRSREYLGLTEEKRQLGIPVRNIGPLAVGTSGALEVLPVDATATEVAVPDPDTHRLVSFRSVFDPQIEGLLNILGASIEREDSQDKG